MMTYVVAFRSNNFAVDSILGGVWGVFSSFDKARQAIDCYREQYNETLVDAYTQPNGIYRAVTNQGYYLIEKIKMDDV